jgi:VanZ family protein
MKSLRYWLPVFVWMLIIFLFSSRQKIQISDQSTINFMFFKTLHLIEYAMLYVLSYRAMKLTYIKKTNTFWYLAAFAITILYAISDEVHQTFVPTREGKLRDVIIDAIGATCSWICINQLLPRTPKKLHVLAKKLGLLS